MHRFMRCVTKHKNRNIMITMLGIAVVSQSLTVVIHHPEGLMFCAFTIFLRLRGVGSMMKQKQMQTEAIQYPR